jgi:uncharacterized Rmd1/YagE family protein
MDTVEEALAWCFDHGTVVSFGMLNKRTRVVIHDIREGKSRVLGQGETLVEAANDSHKNIQEEAEFLQARQGRKRG